MRTLLAAALVLAATSVAAANPPGLTLAQVPDPEAPVEQPAPQAMAPQAIDQAPPRAEKSEAAATGLAIGVTAAGYALAFSGVANRANSSALGGAIGAMIGPSAGHIYAGETKHALGMSALRGVGVTTFAVGLFMGFARGDGAACCGSSHGGDADGNAALGTMAAGAALFIGGTVYDLYDAHRAATRANERAAARQLAIIPVLSHGTQGASAGLALTGNW